MLSKVTRKYKSLKPRIKKRKTSLRESNRRKLTVPKVDKLAKRTEFKSTDFRILEDKTKSIEN